jgi:hypothetical protein
MIIFISYRLLSFILPGKPFFPEPDKKVSQTFLLDAWQPDEKISQTFSLDAQQTATVHTPPACTATFRNS